MNFFETFKTFHEYPEDHPFRQKMQKIHDYDFIPPFPQKIEFDNFIISFNHFPNHDLEVRVMQRTNFKSNGEFLKWIKKVFPAIMEWMFENHPKPIRQYIENWHVHELSTNLILTISFRWQDLDHPPYLFSVRSIFNQSFSLDRNQVAREIEISV